MLKNVKQIGMIGGAVLTVAAGLGISHEIHAVSIDRANAAEATALANQGVSGIGTPDTAAGSVPLRVTATCTVDMHAATGRDGMVTLYLLTADATGTAHRVDSVSNATTAAAVRANLPALGWCK